jgi:hypothetical protein
MFSLTNNAVVKKTAITIFLAQTSQLCSEFVRVTVTTNKAKRLGYCLTSESEVWRDEAWEVLVDHSTDVLGVTQA